MKLSIWDWHEPRLNLFKEYAAQYTALHPDIEFEFSLTSWDSYWAKLPVAIAGGTPPDIAEFHNEQTDRFVDNGFLAPFPEKIFPLAEYEKKWVMFKQAFLLNGKMYFHPDGIMTPAIYYNKDILTASGVDKVPTRWSDFITVAKKLTEPGFDGRYEQVGFQFAGGTLNLFTDLVYQNGGFLFKADKSGVEYGSPAGQAAVGFIEQLLNANVSDERPGTSAPGGFESGAVAMKYNWTWYNGSLTNYPNLNWSVAMVPTPTGSSLPARARNNYECGLAVPATVTPDRQLEAFKFIKWLYDQDSFNIRINILLGRVPGRRDLWTKPELRNDPVYQMLINQASYTVYPGPLPSWFWPTIQTMQDRILGGSVAPQTALTMAVQEGNTKFQEIQPKYIAERQYVAPK